MDNESEELQRRLEEMKNILRQKEGRLLKYNKALKIKKDISDLSTKSSASNDHSCKSDNSSLPLSNTKEVIYIKSKNIINKSPYNSSHIRSEVSHISSSSEKPLQNNFKESSDTYIQYSSSEKNSSSMTPKIKKKSNNLRKFFRSDSKNHISEVDSTVDTAIITNNNLSENECKIFIEEFNKKNGTITNDISSCSSSKDDKVSKESVQNTNIMKITQKNLNGEEDSNQVKNNNSTKDRSDEEFTEKEINCSLKSTTSLNSLSADFKRGKKRSLTNVYTPPSKNSPSTINKSPLDETNKKYLRKERNSPLTHGKINVESLPDIHLEDVYTTCLTLPVGGIPAALVVCPEKFYIYKLIKNKEIPKNRTNYTWKECYTEENSLIHDTNLNSILFGGGSTEHMVEYMMVETPKCGGQFTYKYLSFLEDGKLRNVSTKSEFSGCTKCSIRGCFGDPWNLWLFLDECENPSCCNSSSSGVLWSYSYDLVYSQKRDEWTVILEKTKEIHISSSSLVSLSLLVMYVSSDKYNEESLVVWQDDLGNLGLVNQNFSSVISMSNENTEYDLKSLMASGAILYAADVKEILLLILKTENLLKFVAVNPLSTSQFDVFYEVNFSGLLHDSSDVKSTIFFENKFYFITNDAQILSINL